MYSNFIYENLGGQNNGELSFKMKWNLLFPSRKFYDWSDNQILGVECCLHKWSHWTNIKLLKEFYGHVSSWSNAAFVRPSISFQSMFCAVAFSSHDFLLSSPTPMQYAQFLTNIESRILKHKRCKWLEITARLSREATLKSIRCASKSGERVRAVKRGKK